MTENKLINQLAQAIFCINRHAKAATKPQHLYTIKKIALQKLLHEKKHIRLGYIFQIIQKIVINIQFY